MEKERKSLSQVITNNSIVNKVTETAFSVPPLDPKVEAVRKLMKSAGIDEKEALLMLGLPAVYAVRGSIKKLKEGRRKKARRRRRR